MPVGVLWEAGENPALPRNCKRGEFEKERHWVDARKGWVSRIAREGISNSKMRKSGDRPTANN